MIVAGYLVMLVSGYWIKEEAFGFICHFKPPLLLTERNSTGNF
jgi:hypothetical protein